MPEPWEYASEEEWAETQRRVLGIFGAGGPMAQVIGRVLDVAPPKSAQELAAEEERKRQEQRAREIKAAAERAVPVAAPPRLTITGEPAYGPETTVPLATRRAAEAQGLPAMGGLPLLGRQLQRMGGEVANLLFPQVPIQKPGESEEEWQARLKVEEPLAARGLGLMAAFGVVGGKEPGKAPKGKVPKVPEEAPRKPAESIEELRTQLGEALRGAPKRVPEELPPTAPAAIPRGKDISAAATRDRDMVANLRTELQSAKSKLAAYPQEYLSPRQKAFLENQVQRLQPQVDALEAIIANEQQLAGQHLSIAQASQMRRNRLGFGLEEQPRVKPEIPTAPAAGPAPGFVRLYRGEVTPGTGPALPDWVQQGRKALGIEDAAGRWFTDDLEVANWYVREAGPNARLVYIDVPQEVAEASRVSKQTAARFSRDPEHEYFLSRSLAETKVPTAPAAGEGVVPPPPRGVEPPPAGGEPPEDAVAKLTQLIKIAKPIRAEAEALKHEARVRQAGALGGIFEAQPGKAGMPQAAAQLRGELPKPTFAPPEPELSLAQVDSLFVKIHEAELQPFTEFSTKLALEKVLAGGLPTEGEIAALRRVFGSELAGAISARRGLGPRLWREFWELANLPRAFVSTFYDLSAPFRQGVVLAVRHPKEWTESFGSMLKAYGSERMATEINQALTTGAAAARREAAGLELTAWGPLAEATAREEAFMTRLASKIPGVRMSERAYTTFLNKLRAGIFDKQVSIWDNLPNATTKLDEVELARMLNAATGRGSLGPLRALGQPLAGTFFSPRLVMGRIQYPFSLFSQSAKVRALAAQELVGFLGTGTALLTALEMSGLADVEIDPRSSDFGKIRIGKMRVDIWGGYQPLARYAAQFFSGQRKTLGTGELMAADRREVFLRFLQSKLSPQAGMVVDLWRGESYMGEPMTAEPATLKTQAWNRLAPLFIQDFVEALRGEGVRGGLIAAPAALGIGVQTFYTPGQKVDALARLYDPQKRGVREMSSVELQRLIETHPDLAQARQEQIRGAAKWGSAWAQAKQQQATEDAEFEGEMSIALTQGLSGQAISSGLSAYLRERAIRNQLRFGQVDDDPRNDLERRLDAYYALEPPLFATETERRQIFRQQDEMLSSDAELAGAIRDLRVLRFTDPAVREAVGAIWDARQVRRQYYAIPAYMGLSAEEGEQVNDVLAEAQSMTEMGQAPSRRAAVMMIAQRGQYPQKVILYALSADRLRNPQRRIFKMQHADELSWFESIPVDREAVAV